MFRPKNITNYSSQRIVMSKSDELHKAGLRATLPRKKILQIFEDNEKEHFSAEMVFEKLKEIGEEIGLATVYRVLTQFEEAGLITRNNFESGHAVYEINNGDHHDHLICMNCGVIIEFVDEGIEEKQKEIAEKYSFEVMDHSLTLFGLCEACQSK